MISSLFHFIAADIGAPTRRQRAVCLRRQLGAKSLLTRYVNRAMALRCVWSRWRRSVGQRRPSRWRGWPRRHRAGSVECRCHWPAVQWLGETSVTVAPPWRSCGAAAVATVSHVSRGTLDVGRARSSARVFASCGPRHRRLCRVPGTGSFHLPAPRTSPTTNHATSTVIQLSTIHNLTQ